MAKRTNTTVKPPAPPVAVVVSRYNESITSALLEGALIAYAHAGGRDVTVVQAPGAFELPVLAHAAAKTGRYAAVVALGCLIRGETSHDRIIADAVAQGLVRASIDTGVPITFGVLTVDTPKQARARAGGKHGNKGADAMIAALEAAGEVASLRRGGGSAPMSRKLDKARRD